MKRLLIITMSTLTTIIFLYPNPALFFTFIIAAHHKYIALFSITIFTYQIAKIVQYIYERYLSKKYEELNPTISESDNDAGYSYENKNGKISFTFEVDDHDGRQLSRLIFFRKKFFGDKE